MIGPAVNIHSGRYVHHFRFELMGTIITQSLSGRRQVSSACFAIMHITGIHMRTLTRHLRQISKRDNATAEMDRSSQRTESDKHIVNLCIHGSLRIDASEVSDAM
jgi:hypothetical protein